MLICEPRQVLTLLAWKYRTGILPGVGMRHKFFVVKCDLAHVTTATLWLESVFIVVQPVLE
jgi:hypothetical protein